MNIIKDKPLKKETLDTWVWKNEEEGIFSVRSTYSLLQKSTRGNNSVFTYYWSVMALPKVKHFGWRVLLDMIPTKQKLAIRGIDLGCTLCVPIFFMRSIQSLKTL